MRWGKLLLGIQVCVAFALPSATWASPICVRALEAALPPPVRLRLDQAHAIWRRILPDREAQLALDYQVAAARHTLVLHDIARFTRLELMGEVSAEAWRPEYEQQRRWLRGRMRDLSLPSTHPVREKVAEWELRLEREPLTLRAAVLLGLEVSLFATFIGERPRELWDRKTFSEAWAEFPNSRVSYLFRRFGENDARDFVLVLPEHRELKPLDFVSARAAGIGRMGIAHGPRNYDGARGNSPYTYSSHDISHWNQIVGADSFWWPQHTPYPETPSMEELSHWILWSEHLITRSELAEKLLQQQSQLRSDVALYTEGALFYLLHEMMIPMTAPDLSAQLKGAQPPQGIWSGAFLTSMASEHNTGDDLGVYLKARSNGAWNTRMVREAARRILEWLK